MMARFDDVMQVLFANEGGVSNNAADSGGLTNMGVTQVVYDNYRLQKGLPQQPVTGATLGEATEIYSEQYWAPCKGPQLPIPVDLCVFDAAVNSGVSRAGRMLQASVGATQDGVVGPQTLALVSQAAPVTLAGTFCDMREQFVRAIITANPSQIIFLDGWMNRINRIRHICGVPGY